MARKSDRETAFIRRLLIVMISNVIVIPVLFNIWIVSYCPDGYRGRTKDQINDGTVNIYVYYIAFFEEMILRFLLQAIMVIVWFQQRSDSHTILKTFLSGFMVTGRNKFKHYLYDLGLRNVIAVTMFTMGLCCSVVIPVTSPFCAILFFFAYAIDKYNLFFVYPIDFESQEMNRKILIKTVLAAIMLFQGITIAVIQSMVHQQTFIYLITMLVIQLLVSLVVFEFIRSPWKGVKLTIEEAEEELNQRMFEEEDVDAYDFQSFDHHGETTLIGFKKEVITVDEKVAALKTNYEDPFVDLLKTLE